MANVDENPSEATMPRTHRLLLLSTLLLAPACVEDEPDTATSARALGGDKVSVCHVPPGNPLGAHTIIIGAAAVPAHLAHGDELGECGFECLGEDEACTADADCCLGACADGQCHAVCTPGETRACYGGAPEHAGVGACSFGTETCDGDGGAWGDCVGDGTPSDEVCGDGIDDDCDGIDPSCCVATAEVCDGSDNDCDGVVDDGCIGDRAWRDSDMDGQQGPGELGVGGVTFILRTTVGSIVSVATSDADGFYQFSGVPAGAYYIEALPPLGLDFTSKDQGDDATDSDFDPEMGATDTFSYDGAARDDLDCGLWYLPST
jgi:hypothetical protein